MRVLEGLLLQFGERCPLVWSADLHGVTASALPLGCSGCAWRDSTLAMSMDTNIGRLLLNVPANFSI